MSTRLVTRPPSVLLLLPTLGFGLEHALRLLRTRRAPADREMAVDLMDAETLARGAP